MILTLDVTKEDIAAGMPKGEAYALIKELDWQQHDDEFTRMCAQHFCDRISTEEFAKIVRRYVGE